MKQAAGVILPGLLVVAVAAAGGCVVRAEKQPYRSGVLGDADKSIRYDLPNHVATESLGDGVQKLTFASHELVFANGRIELDGTDVWARRYRDVVVTRGRTGALLMTVDGQPVPTYVHLD